MKNECISAVERAAGRKLTKGELDGIEQRMTTAMRDLSTQRGDEFMAMSPAERVVEAAKMAKERMMKDVAAAQETEVRNAQIRAGLDNFRQSFAPGKNGRLQAAIQRFFYDAGSRAGDTSVEMNRKAIMGDFMRYLTDVRKVDTGKFFGMMQDLTKREAIIKELAGEASNDPEARKIAQTFLDVNKMAAARAERAGIGFHELDNWRSPQAADWVKVARSKDDWIKDHLAWVDRRAYVKASGDRMNETELTSFLEKVWETQATNGSNKRASGEGSGYGGLGTSRSQPRQIHYKDAASYSEAMKKYGRATNVYSLFMQHFNGLSRDIAIAETLGRDHAENFKYLIESSFADDVQAAKTDGQRKALDSMKGRAYRMYDLLSKGEGAGNQQWALAMAGIRSVISSTMLGGLFGAVPDFAMTALTAKMNGMSQIRAMAQSMKGIASKADGEMLERVGLAVEGMQSAAHRFGMEEIGTGAPGMLNEAVHKLSLLAAFDRGMRSGIGLSMMDLLGKLTRDTSLAALKGGDHDFLVTSKGVTDKHWAVWQAADVDKGPNGNRTLLTPEAIYNTPDEKLLPIVQNDIAARSDIYTKAISDLKAQNAKEAGWVESKINKFTAARDRAYKWLRDYDERRQTRVDQAQTKADAQAELLRAKIELAGVEADIAGYIKTENAQGKIQSFLRAVEDGANVDATKGKPVGPRANRAVENYGRSINTIGETYGQKRAAAEAKIKEAQTRVDQLASTSDKEVQGKANDLSKRFSADLKEIENFTLEMQQRAKKRLDYANAYQEKFGKIEGEEIERAKSDAVTKLLATTLSEIQAGARGAAGSSIAEKVAFGLDKAQAGTVQGEIYRMFMLMKQTPLGIAYTHLFQRPAAIEGWKSQRMYQAQFVAYSTLLGALSIQLKAMATGEDPAKMDEGKFWAKAVTAGGGFGIYGDLLFADGAHTSNGIAGLIGGPGLSAAEDAMNLYMGAKKDLTEGGQYKYGSKFLEFGRKYAAPLTNLWYMKAAFNHLIYHNLQEMLDPGWAARMQARMQKKHGTSYWWSPGPHGPERAPDLSNAIR